MRSFDPEFADVSTKQLAVIDTLSSEYEVKRTRGDEITIESFLRSLPVEIQAPLVSELILIELEILESWDQLRSIDLMIGRFPEMESLIREYWQSLQQHAGSPPVPQNEDTWPNVFALGSTHVTGNEKDSTEVPTGPILGNVEDPAPRFKIVRNLAQGGIGTVFVAFDRDLQREVAIKELKKTFATDRSVLQRFEAEATVTGNLEHPNIVPIYAIGKRSDGRPYYAMRLIHGRSMQSAISDLHSPPSSDLDFRRNAAARDLLLRFVTVCRALGFAHSRGILHRDLKPSNIMVGGFGETLVVDWGLAKKLGLAGSNCDLVPLSGSIERPAAGATQAGTQAGTIVGTPGYMSPEQEAGNNDRVTIASDIYSLGATLFQILTNTIPSSNSNMSVGLGTLPAPLAAICRQAMQPDPSKRYQTTESMADDIEAWLLDEPVSVVRESKLQVLRRWAKAHPAIVAGGLASLLITISALAINQSLLSAKNESLREANLREQAAALEATENAEVAKKNGAEAVRQRERVLGILNTFLVNVEKGLVNVPGGAAVQKNVLTTVLNKLGEVSTEFAGDTEMNRSNAIALVDLGDLFSRVGTQEIKLDLPQWDTIPVSPLQAAGQMYAEAMKIAKRSDDPSEPEARRLIALILQKQAQVLRQTARTAEALELLDQGLELRHALLAESPSSMEAAMDLVISIDYQGQIYLQDGNFPRARSAFIEVQEILLGLSKVTPDDIDVKRRLGVGYSRLADVANGDGNLELAMELYHKDLAISQELLMQAPNNLLSKRDYCVSLDRIGNMSAQKGNLEEAMESYLLSRSVREELYAAEPTNVKTIQELLVSYMKGGDTRMLMNQVDAAKSDYEKALALADELAQSDPENALARRFQSLSAEVLADVAIAESRFEEALQYAKRSLAISLELASKDPSNGQMQRDLFIGYLKIAKVFQAKEEYEYCLAELDLALKIVQTVYENQPTELGSIGDYSFVLLKRAECNLAAGAPSTAIAELEKVIPLMESIPEENRQDAKSRRRLANAITMLGRAQLNNGQKSKALATLERSRQLTLAMIDEKMRVDQMTVDLEEIDRLIALCRP